MQSPPIVAPRLSPDGERVAYGDGGRIWVMGLEERVPRRLTGLDTTEGHPVWSRDGRRISFVTWPADGAGGHLWVVELTGASRQVTSRPGYYLFPAFSPRDARIVALRAPFRTFAGAGAGLVRRGSPGGSGAEPMGLELYALPAQGLTLGSPELLVTPVRGWTRPHFSDDPGRVFFWHGEEGLASIRYDGSDRRAHLTVTAPDGETPADEALVSPRGERVALRQGGDVWLMPLPRLGSALAVSLADPDAAPLPLERVARDVDFVAWSVGGTALTWSSSRTFTVHFLDGRPRRVVEVPVAGSGV